MDPLTIIASAIAVGQAGDRLTGLLLKAKRLLEAPDEVDGLVNEIADLNLVLSSLRSAVSEIRRLSDSDSHNTYSLSKLVEACGSIILNLEGLVAYSFSTPSGKVDRVSWARKKTKVEKLRLRLRELKSALAVHLASINSIAQVKIGIDVEEITAITNNMQSQYIKGQSFNATRFDLQDELLLHLINLLTMHPTHQDSSNIQASGDETLPLVRRGSTSLSMPVLSDGHALHSAQSSIRVTAVHYQDASCRPGCKCSCHRRRVLVASATLNKLVGTMFAGYTGQPFHRQSCDEPACRQRSIPAVTVFYFFPHWFIKRALAITFFNEASLSISLSFPKIVDSGSEFFSCIRFGYIDRIKELFHDGLASPADILNGVGLTTLSYAIAHNQFEVAGLLLSAGADPFAPNNTPLARSAADLAWNIVHQYSTPESHREVLRKLIPGPDLENRAFSSLHRLVLGITHGSVAAVIRASRPTIDVRDSAGRSALHWAAVIGNLDVLNQILRCGGNPDLRDNEGRTAMHYAAETSAIECVMALIASGAQPGPADNWNQTPLHLAARLGRNQNIRLLLRANTDVNARNSNDESPLVYTVLSNNLAGVNILLCSGADIELKSCRGYTALLDAIWANAHDVTEELLAKGARHDAQGYDGMTVLHAAAEYGDIRTMEILKDWAILANDTAPLNSDGLTPLDKLKQRVDMSDILVEAFGALLMSVRTNKVANVGVPGTNLAVQVQHVGVPGTNPAAQVQHVDRFVDAKEFQ